MPQFTLTITADSLSGLIKSLKIELENLEFDAKRNAVIRAAAESSERHKATHTCNKHG